jgi:hypothetical protein
MRLIQFSKDALALAFQHILDPFQLLLGPLDHAELEEEFSTAPLVHGAGETVTL